MEETKLGKFSDIVNMEATVCQSATAIIDVPRNVQYLKVGTQEIQSYNIWWILSRTMSDSLATSVLEKPKGESIFTGLGEGCVGELLVGVVSDRNAPVDTILSYTDYKEVKINKVDGMKRAICGLSNLLHDEDCIKSSGGKKIDESVIALYSSMYDLMYEVTNPVMPIRQLIEVRSCDLNSREDDLTNMSVYSAIYVLSHGMCYGVYDNGSTHKHIYVSPPYHR